MANCQTIVYRHCSFRFAWLMGLDKRGQPEVNYGLGTETEFQFHFSLQLWFSDCNSLAD